MAAVRPRPAGVTAGELKARSFEKSVLLSKASHSEGRGEASKADRDDNIARQLLHFAGGSCVHERERLEEVGDGSASETEVMGSKSDDEADEEMTEMMRGVLAGKR